MCHAKIRSRLNRTRGEMRSLILNQSRSMFQHQRMITTYAKAKVVRPCIEKIITLAKHDSLNNRRLVFQKLNDHVLVKEIFEKFAPLFKDVNGGYTRIIKLKNRRGDNAMMVIFELTKRLAEEKPVNVKEKKEKKPKVVQETADLGLKQQEKETPKAQVEEKQKPEGEKPREEKHPEKKFKPSLKDKHEHKPDKFLGGISKMFRRKQEP